MAEVKLTPQQQAVVDHEGGALLVSAAAGSGKTKVLVDRLMRKLCDPAAPKSIDSFLIITYTRAAASELRGKIAAALSARLASEPNNRHLRRQLSRIYLAQISTVHAFCQELLRSYAGELDLPPDFRVAEETECLLLRASALEKTLEDVYGSLEQEPEITAFINTLGAGRDDRRVGEILMQMTQSINCHRDPAAWVAMCRSQLDVEQYADIAETPWGAAILASFYSFLDTQIEVMASALGEIQSSETLPELEPLFSDNLQKLRALRACESWDALYAGKVTDFGRWSKPKHAADALQVQRLQRTRAQCWEALKERQRDFYASSAELLAELRSTAPVIRGILILQERYAKAYAFEKRRRHILDFGDLEHEALRLLCQRGSGAPTAVAREVSQRYCEIMIDEYQDTNGVQDAIFTAISDAGRNLFFVGDVKQSIYRFRLADPTIFLEKYRSFAPQSEAAAGEPVKILLNENFRSRPEVLDAVNAVFRRSMSEQVGDIDYGEAESLRSGLPAPERREVCVELDCIDTDFDPDTAKKPSKIQVEANYTAHRIAELLRQGVTVQENGEPRPLRPDDIVILLRSVRSAVQDYVQALEAVGLKTACESGLDIFDTTEGSVLLSLLQVLDNPHQDIPLASVMASPLFGFSDDELAQARIHQRKGDLFDALFAQPDKSEKLKTFLRQLEQLRQTARQETVTSLLRRLFQETAAEEVFGAMPDGARRVQNLQNLWEFAMNCEAMGQYDLPQFLAYLEAQRAQGATSTDTTGTAAGCVRIMSIHKSKGLEFPVVILGGLSRKMNVTDLSRPVLSHPVLGAGANVVDAVQRVQYPSIAKKAIAQQLRREMVSEELRVLYVAMTRAKQKLIMTYCEKGLTGKLETLATDLDIYPPQYLARSANTLGHWVLLAAMCRTEAGELFAGAAAPRQCCVSDIPWEIHMVAGTDFAQLPRRAVVAETEEPAADAIPPQASICQALDYTYPYPVAAQTPTKLTATQLKGRYLDEELEDTAPTRTPRRYRKPAFSTEGRELSAAEIGTATHLAMQFIRYEACTSLAGVEAEIRRLREERFLTDEQAGVVEAAKIARCFASPLGQEIRAAKKVLREFKFSVLVDASRFFPEAGQERIMLQGVVDCCLFTEEGITVIDYKTDRVRPGEEEAAARRYQPQLDAYSQSLAEIFDQPVQKRLLYFFATGAIVAVP